MCWCVCVACGVCTVRAACVCLCMSIFAQYEHTSLVAQKAKQLASTQENRNLKWNTKRNACIFLMFTTKEQKSYVEQKTKSLHDSYFHRKQKSHVDPKLHETHFNANSHMFITFNME